MYLFDILSQENQVWRTSAGIKQGLSQRDGGINMSNVGEMGGGGVELRADGEEGERGERREETR